MPEDTQWGRAATLDMASQEGQRGILNILEESRRWEARQRSIPDYHRKVVELEELLDRVRTGRSSPLWLQETMTSDDFPVLFGDIIHRRLLGGFTDVPSTWRDYTRETEPATDFADIKLVSLSGLDGRWTPIDDFRKAEMQATREVQPVDATTQTYHVDVYEKALAWNWRMGFADQYNYFSAELAQGLARGARRTEQFAVTSLYVDANGPHASLYNNTNKNLINTTNGSRTNNPVLSVDAMIDAFNVMARLTDPFTGEPIVVEAATLVVPPALRTQALFILNATQIAAGGNGQTGLGGVAGQQLIGANWMRNNLSLAVDYYIPTVASTANGNTSWFLFANPNQGQPAMVFTRLAGYDAPRLYQKAPDAIRIGGGVDRAIGDFETGEIKYKCMNVFGVARVQPRATIASNGSGS